MDFKYGLTALVFFLVLLYLCYLFRKKQNRKIIKCPNCNKTLYTNEKQGDVICINKNGKIKNIHSIYSCEKCGVTIIEID